MKEIIVNIDLTTIYNINNKRLKLFKKRVKKIYIYIWLMRKICKECKQKRRVWDIKKRILAHEA